MLHNIPIFIKNDYIFLHTKFSERSGIILHFFSSY